MKDVDPRFYDRADAHIHLSNEQLGQAADHPGGVSASMMYATALFNAWWTANTFESREHFQDVREEVLEYLCEQYRMMLEDHLDDCVARFEAITGRK